MTSFTSKHPTRTDVVPSELTPSEQPIGPQASNARSAVVGERVAPELRTSEHEQIALLASWYWQERGCPEGSPEQDWFRAEHAMQLHTVAKQVDHETGAPVGERTMSKSA